MCAPRWRVHVFYQANTISSFTAIGIVEISMAITGDNGFSWLFFHDAIICLSCFLVAETWGSTPHSPTYHF